MTCELGTDTYWEQRRVSIFPDGTGVSLETNPALKYWAIFTVSLRDQSILRPNVSQLGPMLTDTGGYRTRPPARSDPPSAYFDDADDENEYER
jgi:hypothetical protein